MLGGPPLTRLRRSMSAALAVTHAHLPAAAVSSNDGMSAAPRYVPLSLHEKTARIFVEGRYGGAKAAASLCKSFHLSVSAKSGFERRTLQFPIFVDEFKRALQESRPSGLR